MKKLKRFLVALLVGFCGASCVAHDKMQPLPAELAIVPTEILRKANVILLGTYKVGRTPCEFLPDGTRRWGRTTGFTVEKTLRGTVNPIYIETHLISESLNEPELQWDKKYYVFFDADASLLKKLMKADNIYFRDAIGIQNVLAIVSEEGQIEFKRPENNQRDTDSAPASESGNLE